MFLTLICSESSDLFENAIKRAKTMEWTRILPFKSDEEIEEFFSKPGNPNALYFYMKRFFSKPNLVAKAFR